MTDDKMVVLAEQDDGSVKMIEPTPPCDRYIVSRELLVQMVARENQHRWLEQMADRINARLLDEMRAPHLEYASSRQLREMLVLRARMRLPWNKPKRTHPTNGHGTWLPVYWTWSRVDGDPLQQLGKRRWMKELDHPYRRGTGYGIPLGNVMLEVGVCRRKNLERDPDQFGDYDDPGAVDALRARPLDDGIAEISTQYRGVTNVAQTEDS